MRCTVTGSPPCRAVIHAPRRPASQSPVLPIRNLISSCFTLAYSRGARQNMYTTVGLLLSWMNNKTSPASTTNSKAQIATRPCRPSRPPALERAVRDARRLRVSPDP